MKKCIGFFIMLLAIIIVSCKSTENNITVEGVIMDSVAKAPIGNTSFILLSSTPGGISKPSQTIPNDFTTDGNGKFTVSFKAYDHQVVQIIFPTNDLTHLSSNDFIWSLMITPGQTYFNAGVIYTKKP